jgi:hypothetical protein
MYRDDLLERLKDVLSTFDEPGIMMNVVITFTPVGDIIPADCKETKLWLDENLLEFVPFEPE